MTLERDAHAGAVLALATIPPDAATGRPLLVVSTSMDGTVATWTLDPSSGAMAPREKLAPADGSAPWWCVVPAGDGDAVYVGTHARDARAVDARRIAAEHEHRREDADRSRVSNHTGWVRAVAVLPGFGFSDDDEKDVGKDVGDDVGEDVGGGWGFSAACNVVRAWRVDEVETGREEASGTCSDTSDARPTSVRHLSDAGVAREFTGDILALASTPGRLFCGVADGTVRGWSVRVGGGTVASAGREGPVNAGPVAMSPLRRPDDAANDASGGERRTELPRRGRDHPGRVAALVAVGAPPPRRGSASASASARRWFVVSGCHGGTLRSWAASDLAPLGVAHDAHGPWGAKVRCAVAASGFRSEGWKGGGGGGDGGGGGVDFYSGGDDGWVRAWAVDGTTGEIRPVAHASFRATEEDGAGVGPVTHRPGQVRAIAEVTGDFRVLIVGDHRGSLSTWRVG